MDNRCCHCLYIKEGVIGISIFNAVAGLTGMVGGFATLGTHIKVAMIFGLSVGLTGLVGLIMSVVLVIGANINNTKMILSWLVVSALHLLMWLATALLCMGLGVDPFIRQSAQTDMAVRLRAESAIAVGIIELICVGFQVYFWSIVFKFFIFIRGNSQFRGSA